MNKKVPFPQQNVPVSGQFDLIVCGGGSRNLPLMELLAKITNCTVTAGTVEATAVGNLLCQKYALEKYSR